MGVVKRATITYLVCHTPTTRALSTMTLLTSRSPRVAGWSCVFLGTLPPKRNAAPTSQPEHRTGTVLYEYFGGENE